MGSHKSIRMTLVQMVMVGWIVLILAGITGCTKFHEVKDASYVTLSQNIFGDICASTSEEIQMPVKILLVVDISASNGGAGIGGTDPIVDSGLHEGTTKRLRAFRNLLETYVPTAENYDPGSLSQYHFGLIVFNGSPEILTADADGQGLFYQPIWREDSAWQALKAVEMRLVEGTGTTNYVRAFETIKDFIKADIKRTDETLVSRTTYKIIYVSDGIPDDGRIGSHDLADEHFFWPDPAYFTGGFPPLEGCITNPYSSPSYSRYCPRGFTNEAGANPTNYPIRFRGVGATYVGLYGDYLYNVIYDIGDQASSVYKIIDRTNSTEPAWRFYKEGAFDNVAYIPREVSWNTIFYTQAGTNPKLQAQNYVAETILRDTADHGNGTFVNYGDSDISFSNNLDLVPAQRRYQLYGFFVENKNAVILPNGEVAPDSDGDLLHDDLERLIRTNPLNPDTDEDGLGDGIEYFYTNYDPLNWEAVCNFPGALSDKDNDGLNNCEENQLMTSDTLFDTDSDGIPDWIEIRYGLNPNRNDRNDDNNFSGMNNFNEITMHRNPNVPYNLKLFEGKNAYSFKMKAYKNSANNNCYQIEIKNIEIVKTISGINNIQIFSVQIPEDNPSERGIFSRASIQVDFNTLESGDASNTLKLEDIRFTTY